MQTIILLTLIFTVLLYPLTNWMVNNYAQLITIKKEYGFLSAIVLAVGIAFILTVLSTDYAIKQVLSAYNL